MKKLLFAVTLLMLSCFVHAQTPGIPDDCSDALRLPINPDACGRASLCVDLSLATSSSPFPASTCTLSPSFVGNDIWFEVVVPPTGNFMIRKHAKTKIKPVIETYIDCPSTTFSPDKCQVLNDKPNAMVFQGLSPGNTIYLRVWDSLNLVVNTMPGDAIVELSVHELSTNANNWELCDHPMTEGVPNKSEFGGGRKKANEFMIQYHPNASAADIAAIQGDLIAMGAILKDVCDCTNPRLELWHESDPTFMETCKQSASRQKGKVDTANYNYIVEDIVCEEIIPNFLGNLSFLFEAFITTSGSAPSGNFIIEFNQTPSAMMDEITGYYEYNSSGAWVGGFISGYLNNFPFTAYLTNIVPANPPSMPHATASVIGTVYNTNYEPIGVLSGTATDRFTFNGSTEIMLAASIFEYNRQPCGSNGSPAVPFVDYLPNSPTKSVVVAVSDSGIEFNLPGPVFHPRLDAAHWTNPNPNTCVANDDYGYDFVSNTANPADGDDHGTPVSGIVVSQCPDDIDLDIMPSQMYYGEGTAFDGACSVHYAVVNRADVLNMSWGFEADEFPQILYDAIARANCNDIIATTSAGNLERDNDTINKYPANFELENIISVAAYDNLGGLIVPSSYSNSGAINVDIAAPGFAWSTELSNDIKEYAGTSIAAPFVAHAAAVIKANFPELSALQIKDCILSQAQPENGLDNFVLTKGILNLNDAFMCAEGKYNQLGQCNFNIIATTREEICFGENGEIDLIFDGVPPFDMEWSDGTIVNAHPDSDYTRFDLAAACYRVNVTDANGCTASTIIEITNSQNCVRIAPKVFLQGPFNNGIGVMDNALLTNGLIPINEPYGTVRGEILNLNTAINPSDEIVDWILVELRDKFNPVNILASRAALVQRDGDVVDTDGESVLMFPMPEDDYYISIRHRNHLGVMSNDLIHLTE